MMTAENLEKELNTDKPLSSLYLFYGDEKYLLDNCVKKIKKKFNELLQGINYIIIDETNLEELIYNIETPAFGYDQKLILVKNSGLFKKDGRKKQGTPLQEKIATYFKNTPLSNDVVLVFLEVSIEKNNVFDSISQKGIVVEFKELDEASLIRKLKQITNLYQVTVSDATLKYFIQVSGTNMQFLINEIRKLIEFVRSKWNY